ncbi:ROK family protein [Hyphomonas sp.]|uniref:ROK family protein n=1 Tax=Hyphomonas sp. TaxID=87 RepID=UPI0025BF3D0B|nr:ROK family protein [Hyphomonas sp.]MBI1400929.1 ROK family protein [Hyphomonas sp.]
MTSEKPILIGGIDAGGTMFKCALAEPGGRLIETVRVPTTTPADTIAACLDFFRWELDSRSAKLGILGIASFGPINVDPASPDYGTLGETPKPGWSGTRLSGRFFSGLGAPIVLDTDVNGALAGEIELGAAKGVRTAAYVTIGTGIGAGVHGPGGYLARPAHPEIGHIRVQRHPDDTAFAGTCRFHRDCLEGLASGTSLIARYGDPAELASDDPVWDVEAFYIAQACAALVLTTRPDRILLGGGVMQAAGLVPKVRAAFARLMNGYLGLSDADIENLIQRPALGDNAGLIGAVTLARQNLKEPAWSG